MSFNTRILKGIDQCDSADWDNLFNSDYPFLKHRFLSILESSGSVCAKTGWEPRHLLLEQDEKLVAALPLYLKHHSWGEYVFDHAWADAYHNNGFTYYPKLLTAIPFTPTSGQRIGIAAEQKIEELMPHLMYAIQSLANEWDISGWHLLFPEPNTADQLQKLGAMQRIGIQYHWHNDHYQSFDDFVSTLTSRKRKNILRERRIAGQELQIKRLVGQQITAEWWDFFHVMYHRTYLKRSGYGGYLTEDFFKHLGDALNDQIMMCVAEQPGEESNQKVAAALFFFDSNRLYGRYWGCLQEYDFLHFELCYYQGIEFAIEHNLTLFDAGAQGEHKIKRGFKPIKTYSSHWIKHPEFAKAIQHFLNQEIPHINTSISQACELLPYKANNK